MSYSDTASSSSWNDTRRYLEDSVRFPLRGGLTNLASSSNCSFTLASHLVSCHSSLLFSSSLQLTSLHTLPPSALSFRSSAVSLSCRVLLSRELNQRQSSPAPSNVESVLPKQKRKRQIRRANALIFSKTYVSSIPSSIQSSSMDSNKHHIYLLSFLLNSETSLSSSSTQPGGNTRIP